MPHNCGSSLAGHVGVLVVSAGTALLGACAPPSSNPPNWDFVAIGVSHTLAIKTDHTLWAWGDNYYGQLGTGDTTNRLTPTRVGTDMDWVAAAGAWGHTVALKPD